MLGVSLRQAQRLAARYRDGGGGALIHKSQLSAGSESAVPSSLTLITAIPLRVVGLIRIADKGEGRRRSSEFPR